MPHPCGREGREITAPFDGVVVGRAVLPAVREGDAMFHLARVDSTADAESAVDEPAAQPAGVPPTDEDEII